MEVSFPHRLVVGFPRRNCANQNAVVLGDVDNDNDIELAVGCLSGELAIFKGSKENPWKYCDHLGTINCIVVGNLRNEKKNSLVVLTGEGYCFLFDVDEKQKVVRMASHRTQDANESSMDNIPYPPLLKTSHGHENDQIQASSSSKDLHSAAFTAPVSPSSSQPQSSFVFPSPAKKTEEDNRWATDHLKVSFSHRVIHNANSALIADIDEDNENELIIATSGREVYAYKLVKVGKNKDVLCLETKRRWVLPDKPSSLSKSMDSWGRPILMIGQNSVGYYSIIDHRGNLINRELKNSFESEDSEYRKGCILEIKDFSRPTLLNAQKVQTRNLIAMVTLSGTVQLREDQKILWKQNFKEQLFCLNACDLMELEADQVVVSSWEGTTYIIDENQKTAVFHFEDQVCAFTAGRYSTAPNKQVPCLVYVTFHDEIIIVYDIYTPALQQLFPKKKQEPKT